MKKEDIIAMAREARFEEIFEDSGDWICFTEEIEKFAALVAAAERERIIATNAPEIEKANAYIKLLEEAVAAEREACASRL